MTSTFSKTTVIVAVLAAIAISVFFVQKEVNGDAFALACTTSTVQRVSIGHQASTLILATSSRRAYAMLQQVDNASNTVNIAFASGTPATVTTGLQLHKNSATGTVMSFEFGLNTMFPYTGAVTARTDGGSTTINVTDCSYNR